MLFNLFWVFKSVVVYLPCICFFGTVGLLYGQCDVVSYNNVATLQVPCYCCKALVDVRAR